MSCSMLELVETRSSHIGETSKIEKQLCGLAQDHPAGELRKQDMGRGPGGCGALGKAAGAGACLGLADAGVHSDVGRDLGCCGEQGLTETVVWNCGSTGFVGSSEGRN